MADETSFRERLIDELNYQGISNKDFASMVGISMGTLGMYLYRGSIPAADVAVRMAQVLHTTTEYLVLGGKYASASSSGGTKSDWQRKELAAIAGSLDEKQLEHFLAIARAYKDALSD
ncbi:MAG: helix-turn-helix transcriptional regulator [Treponema sp.]|nr:helix-turn-helix transcriptional regulator [Treponema sp.]